MLVLFLLHVSAVTSSDPQGARNMCNIKYAVEEFLFIPANGI
jgi:hypothetical protein